MTVARLRRGASRVRQRWFPSPAVAAWRQACRAAARAPRHTPGEITLDGYRIAYTDLLTLCPQWHDIFVAGSLRFDARTERPRVLDCGANVGLASLYLKARHPGARIAAYEADPRLAAICRRNLANNGAADVDVQAAAVWTQNGMVRFQQDGADSGAIEGTSAGLSAPATASVPSIRLRDVLAGEANVDLLKLDIEGAEHAVLADCRDVLGRVQAMLIDVHEFDPARRRMPAVLELVAQAGFRYAIDNLTVLPWRATADDAPFPRTAAAWAVLVRAWRPRT